MQNTELYVTKGPLEGKRFTLDAGGVRIGRSSTCEIAIADPALSRHHCMVEMRDGKPWLIDLDSANGTFLNNAPVGVEGTQVVDGDEISIGNSVLRLEVPRIEDEPSPTVDEYATTIDLGLGTTQDDFDGQGEGEKPNRIRQILWGLAFVAVAAAAWLIMTAPDDGKSTVRATSVSETRLRTFSFEAIKADTNGIFRYALDLDNAGVLRVRADDLPQGGRNVEKTKQLDKQALQELTKLFAESSFDSLENQYSGPAAGPCQLVRTHLKAVFDKHVKSVQIENAPEPEAFRELRGKLETFSQHELGIVGIQLPREELLAKCEDAVRTADEKWEARDVELGNVFASLTGYDEAVYYLETVNPKPTWYANLLSHRDVVKAELDKRWKDHYFLVDKAIHESDWAKASQELVTLCAIIPKKGDARYEEARKKLLDVEARAKKGGAK